MKKILTILILSLLLLTLTACGSEPAPYRSPQVDRVPSSKGPTSPPHISEPTLPPPK